MNTFGGSADRRDEKQESFNLNIGDCARSKVRMPAKSAILHAAGRTNIPTEKKDARKARKSTLRTETMEL